MAKIPKKPEEIFAEITGDYQKVFGADLVSIVLYGSGAGEGYIPGKSDLNFLIMLTGRGIERFDDAMAVITRWRKRNVSIPLFMTSSALLGSRDAYPIEFLNMKRHYVVLFGPDVLAGLTFEPCHVRLQLERELQGKLIHLRSGYIATEGSIRKIRELIGASLTAFVSLFGALLYLKDLKIPGDRQGIIMAAGEASGVDTGIFLACEAIRRKTDRFSSEEVRIIFKKYIEAVSRLGEQVEGMETSLVSSTGGSTCPAEKNSLSSH